MASKGSKTNSPANFNVVSSKTIQMRRYSGAMWLSLPVVMLILHSPYSKIR